MGDFTVKPGRDPWEPQPSPGVRARELAEWLERHRYADEIVYHISTGEPVKAVYSTLCGIPRRYPLEFYWEPME